MTRRVVLGSPEISDWLETNLGGERRLIAVAPDGKIDISETIEILEQVEDTGQTVIPGCRALADFMPQKTKAADPVTGEPLFKDRHHWAGIGDDVRLVAAYAVERGEIPPTVEASRDAADILRKPFSEWGWKWQERKSAWGTLASMKNPTPGQAATIASVRGRLVWRAKTPPARQTVVLDPPPEAALSAASFPCTPRACARPDRTSSARASRSASAGSSW